MALRSTEGVSIGYAMHRQHTVIMGHSILLSISHEAA